MKKILILASLLLVTACLSADAPKGAYIGLGFGSSQFDDGGYAEDFDDSLIGVAVREDYSDIGHKLYGGYQFNKVVAVELSRTKYGKHSLDLSNGYRMILKPTSIGIAANIGYNLGKNSEFRPFATIGLSSLNLNETGTLNIYSDDSGGALKFGFGFEYAPVKLHGVGFRIAYEGDFYSLDTSDYSSFYFEDAYFQSVSIFYLGAQYKF